MSDKKQTAVEWLQDVYNTQGRILKAQFEQALEMEREQIQYAHVQGGDDWQKVISGETPKFNDEVDYFIKTYGADNSKIS